jgi:antitoxin MazE
MEIPVIKIGNSKGIRLSKTLLEKYNITDKVTLVMDKDQIRIMPVRKPREGWEEAFQTMASVGDDNLLMPDVFEDEGFEEWK